MTWRGLRTVNCLAWSPDGKRLAAASDEGLIKFFDAEGNPKGEIRNDDGWVTCLAWSPDGRWLAFGTRSGIVRVWKTRPLKEKYQLEGHAGDITGVTFSADFRFLATEAQDGMVRVWHTKKWSEGGVLRSEPFGDEFTGPAFHPFEPILAAADRQNRSVVVWKLEAKALSGATLPSQTSHITSAKVALVGESKVGKSTLAHRIVHDTYMAQDSTLGLRFWTLPVEELDPSSSTPGERREVIFWDMGGQGEYGLVHQLFLRDTSLAVVLCELTRGPSAFEEVEGWCKRLDKQQAEIRPARRLLVGTKLDDDSMIVDTSAVKRLVKKGKFHAYYLTSAMTSRGLPDLKKGIAAAIDWAELTKVSRVELQQRVVDEVSRCRRERKVVLYYAELEKAVRQQVPDQFDSLSVNSVVSQLAVKGHVVDTRLPNQDRVLVLQIDEVERYACSLIVAARDHNPRGLPALEEARVPSPSMKFPGIKEEDRLPRDQEVVVLQCVVELFLRHGICWRHHGLLFFPTLFRSVGVERPTEQAVATPVYYEVSGAIDSIYASLVVELALSERFGRPRLAEDKAEFEDPGQGLCGVQRISLRNGFARLDVFFGPGVKADTQRILLDFVSYHLEQHGVEIVEHVKLVCPRCGDDFQEEKVRERISNGKSDIGCERCDKRVDIREAVSAVRPSDPELQKRSVALRTKVNERKELMADMVKESFELKPQRLAVDRPLRVLHLSDLHFSPDTDPIRPLQRLETDLRNRDEGLGFDELDYVVLSGDFGHCATPEEFDRALKFTEALLKSFRVDLLRCIVVPGNHDLSWEVPVYDWQPKRKIEISKIESERIKQQGDGYLVRNEARYPDRFDNFSKHFYYPLFQQSYPRNPQDQCLSFLFPDTGLQFLAMNSCWQIDEQFFDRSSIHDGALTRGLRKADEEVRKNREENRLAPSLGLLRIAVWHHPVTGSERMKNDDFLLFLRQVNVKLCLHGHVHEARNELVGYLHPKQLHVAGTGSFGAPAIGRPESTPRLYNVIEIGRDFRRIKVHTRCQRKDTGAWEPWAVWPTGRSGERQASYEILL